MRTTWPPLVRALAAAVAVALAAVVALLVGAGVTGHDRRSYGVLHRDDTVTLAGAEQTASELAGRYVPITRLDPSKQTPPLLKTYYEVVDSGETYTLLYNRVWADEVHPNPLVNAVYRLYRAAVYGTPPRDVERTSIVVAKGDGSITTVVFEGGGGQPYDSPQPAHDVVVLSRRSDGGYDQTVTSASGSTTTVVTLPLNGVRVVMGNATWNHLSTLVTSEMSTYSDTTSEPLEELTDDLYADGKYARKGPAGAYATTEDASVRWVATAISFVAALSAPLTWGPARRRPRT